MIKKLYNLKKLQTNQELLQKQQLLASIQSAKDEIEQTNYDMLNAKVSALGAINNFKILAIHKNTMKEHIIKLNKQVGYLKYEVTKKDKILIQLNKETEQFKYMKEQQDKENFKKILKAEEEASNEYVQSRWAIK
jgi:gamma-glutamyl phosphate reductase